MKKTIKKIIIIAVYIILIIAGTKVYALSAKTINETTRLRKKPTTDSAIIELINKSSKVEIIEETGNWYKVKYAGNIGYIRKDMLKVEEKTSSSNKEENTTNTTKSEGTATNTQSEQETESSSQNQQTETNSQSEQETESSNPNQLAETNSQSEQENETNNQNEQEETDSNNEAESELQESNSNTQSEENSIKEVIQIGYCGKLISDLEIKILPTINSTVIATINKNTQFTITDIMNKWCYIETENISGWALFAKIETEINNEKIDNVKEEENKVNSQNKTENKEETEKKVEEKKEENNKSTGNGASATETKTNTQNKTVTKYVSVETLNLRKTADSNGKVVKRLALNTKVTVLEEVNSTWSKVEVNGNTGYVASQYLSTSKKDTSSRSENINRNNNNTAEDNNNSNNTNSNNNNNNNNANTNNSNSSNNNNTNKNNSNNGNNTNNANTNNTNSNNKENKQTEQNTNKETTNKTSAQETTSNGGVTGADVVAYAKNFLGCKYVYGGSSPSGFDCSGFTQYVYKHFGISINRTASTQMSNGVAVSKANLQAGDLVFFNNPSNKAIGHVGIYIGGNTFIHAANSKKGLITTSMSDSYYSARYVGARRILK